MKTPVAHRWDTLQPRAASNDTAADQDALFEIVDQVLHGELHDAPLPIPQAPPDWAVPPATDDAYTLGNGDGDGTGSATSAGITDPTNTTGGVASGFPVGVGVREDGTPVDLTGRRPSARAWIYERFATLISRISMDQAGTGSPYALVVTATAEDLAHRTGEGTTGVETPIPIHELVTNGLNGDVFFHLMSETAHTMQVMTEKRFANKKQVAVITARDKGCTFPGCDAPPGWCEANHVVPWARGGKTTINNLALACSAHHHLLDRPRLGDAHASGWASGVETTGVGGSCPTTTVASAVPGRGDHRVPLRRPPRHGER